MLEKVMPSRNYLDIGMIDFAREREYICFVRSVRIKFTEAAGNFATLQLIDKNSMPIVARAFNIGNGASVGYDLNTFSNRPVVIKATANHFGNRLSLIVTEIKNAPNDVDLTLFRGEIPETSSRVEEYIKFLQERGVESRFSRTIGAKSHSELCGGKVGGFALLMHSVMLAMSVYETTGLVGTDIYKFVDSSLWSLEEHMKLKQSMDVPATAELLGVIQSACFSLGDVRDRNIASDCCAAVLGMSEPRHLYSHLIVKAVKFHIDSTNLIYMYPTVLEGTTATLEEGFLSKY